ncbi:hypothetical protein [Curtobacterium sp. MCBD17_028]|uniref:hypothetical protein n=1 Tax=Curtobacterium sp. MCBD17_028 TaxID=2175670 RepID=UPI000DA8665B|nr:hypothetical protein [Curtobacterium sp. MCBD17_028]PZE23887.1 hypothetical protein DEI86_13670 [Curtobacterium sp. MCBD17_028]
MALQTRKPTGLPSWPIGLLAGKEKTGKSWACAQASASRLVARTLWIGIGENDPDEYGVVPGADFEIVLHDGSYRGILGAVRDAVAEPRGDRPNLIVVDSGTRLWNLITDNAQVAANRRAKGRKNANNDYTISMDLWNVAAQQWKDVMDVLRSHDGPVLVTARLDEVAVMDGGQPTTERTWKVQGHKSLPFDVDWVVEMRERGKYLLTGVRSAHMPLEGPQDVKGWTVDAMWSRLGIEQGAAMGARTHSDTVRESEDGEQSAAAPRAQRPQGSGRNWIAEADQVATQEGANALWRQIPPHEKSPEIRERMRAAVTAAQAREPEPEPQWAEQQAPEATTSWATAEVPQSEGGPMALDGVDEAEAEPESGYDR